MLTIEPFTILWTVIDLLILFLLMKKFLFKPINAILDSRAKSIADSLSQAETQRQEAEQLRAQSQEQLSQSRQQASDLISQAKAQSQELYEKTVTEAQAEAKRIAADSAARNEHDRRAMLQGVRAEAAARGMAAAKKVAEGGDADIDDFLREAGEEK